MPKSNHYGRFYNSGFYKIYKPKARKENLFFVFEHGTTERTSYSETKIKTLKKRLLDSIRAAEQISLQTEYGLVTELCSHLDNDSNLTKTIKEYLKADANYSEIQGIIQKGGATSQAELMQFFNSRYFNTMTGTLTAGDIVMNSRGEKDLTDAFWRKLHQDTWGLQTAASKAVTYQEAFERMKSKWKTYGYTQKGNTWSVVGDYFGSMGQAFQKSGLEDELLIYFMSEISKGKKTPDQIKALIAQGDQAKFEMQRTDKGDLTQKHGQFQEILANILNEFYLPQIYGQLGVGVTLTHTGNDSRKYSKMDLSSGKLVRADEYNVGQTDLKINFDFNDTSKFSSKYQVNISAKMNQGFARLENEEKRHTDKYLTHIYSGGTLGSALNRIYSSPVFSETGMLTEDNFIDLAYLLINAAQGGISENNKDQAVQAYKAAISFVGMEEIGNTLGFDSSKTGKNIKVAGLDIGASTVVNLFLINGKYITASAFFSALYDFINDNETKAMSTNITFAKTFDESELTASLENQRIYSQGYLNFINSNNLGSQKSHNNFTFTQGDPVKVRDYIMSKTKAQEFNIKWTTFWRTFSG